MESVLSAWAIPGVRKRYQPARSRVDRVIVAIMDVVLDELGVEEQELRSTKRNAPFVLARKILARALRRYATMSLNEIGTFMCTAENPRDHTTILYYLKSIQDRIDTDPEVHNTILILDRRIESRMHMYHQSITN